MNRPYMHPRKKHTIKKVNNFICYKCKEKKISEELEIDHIIPVSEGGTSNPSNLMPICIECHKEKTMKEWGDYNSEKNNGLSTKEKLSRFKKFIIENKECTFYEIQFLAINHPLISQFEFNSIILNKLFNKYNNIEQVNKNNNNSKYKEQRDIILYALRKTTKMTYEQISNLLGDYDFEMSIAQVGQVCSKFGDKEKLIKSFINKGVDEKEVDKKKVIEEVDKE